MITCKPYHATISENTCIARQKLINQKHHKGNGKNWGNSGEKTLRNEACLTCQVGINLYQRSLKGEEFTMVEKPETKTCPCGVVFARMPDQPLHAWNRAKYCAKHSAMTSYQRDKIFKTADSAKSARTEIVPEKSNKPRPNTNTPVKPQKRDQQEGNERQGKVQACSLCGKEFPLDSDHFQKNCGNKSGYDTGCKDCRNKIKRAKRARRKTVGFDQEKVKEIIREVITSEIDYLDSLGAEVGGMPEPLCERIAVEVCRRMVEAA